METKCACGKLLHYNDKYIQRLVEMIVMDMGELISVTVLFKKKYRTFLVQRHYIALHGIKAIELPKLGFEEI